MAIHYVLALNITLALAEVHIFCHYLAFVHEMSGDSTEIAFACCLTQWACWQWAWASLT